MNEYKYIKIEVTRTESTDIYLKVPLRWKPSWKNPSGEDKRIILEAVKETITEDCWDDYGWENTLEGQGWELVDEEEAKHYAVYDAMPLLTK